MAQDHIYMHTFDEVLEVTPLFLEQKASESQNDAKFYIYSKSGTIK